MNIAIVNDLTLVARHKAAWDRVHRGRKEWIEGTIDLATVIAEEWALTGSNQKYSHWLERNGLAEITRHARSALIGMAKDLTVTREVLEKTDRTSWEYIWRFEHPNYKQHGHVGTRMPYIRQTGTQAPRSETKRPMTKAEYLRTTLKPLTTLTREQVDPDFQGTDIQFAAQYGHVCLQPKTEIEEGKKQDVLNTWLAAVSEAQRALLVLANTALPDLDTLKDWLTKPNKADKLQAWAANIEAGYAKFKTRPQ
jgi:hypothetical protein